jgi:hypothetical protein
MNHDELLALLVETIRKTERNSDMEVMVSRTIEILARLARESWGGQDSRWAMSQPAWIRAIEAINQHIRESQPLLTRILDIAAKAESCPELVSMEELILVAETNAIHWAPSREDKHLREMCLVTYERLYKDALVRDYGRAKSIRAIWECFNSSTSSTKNIEEQGVEEPEQWEIRGEEWTPRVLLSSVRLELLANRQAGFDLVQLLLAPNTQTSPDTIHTRMDYCEAVLKSFGLLAVEGLSELQNFTDQLDLAQTIRIGFENLAISEPPLPERISLIIRSLLEHEAHCRYHISKSSG